MRYEVTTRDRIWAAILAHAARDEAFSLSDLRLHIHFDHRPSDEEIRRVLEAGLDVGILSKTQSGYFTVSR